MTGLRIVLCAGALGVSACTAPETTAVVQAPERTATVETVLAGAALPAASPSARLSAAGIAQVFVGQASWYGSRFHGRRTASGEPFDMNGLTAAHKTLPFGTRVRVVNESNGKAVVVRVNDRGPFSGKRIIDLSRKAAEAIGLKNAGVGRVKLEVLERT